MKNLPQRMILSMGILLALTIVITRPSVVVRPAYAQSFNGPGQPGARPKWFAKFYAQAMRAPLVRQILRGDIPDSIPQHVLTADVAGTLATFQPNGPTPTANNGFFADLGTNGRTCFSCHQPQAGWAMNPSTAQAIFFNTYGKDPLFAPVDGTNCPDTGAAAKTIAQKSAASSQLLTKGNIRIFLPIPDSAEYRVRIVRDPYGCASDPKHGAPIEGISMYRRVLNSTNLTLNAQFADFVTFANVPQGAIMWDGREPTLASQFRDATLGHAQATADPSDDAINGAVNGGVPFELGLFTAQIRDYRAGSLTADGANGGAVKLTDPLIGGVANVFNAPGIFVLGALPFTIYDAWSTSTKPGQASISRGQRIFNEKQFTIDGVAGFNDAFGDPPPPVPFQTCATCHNALNMGGDAVPDGRHLGIGDNSRFDQSGRQTTATVLPPTLDQPLFSFLCEVGKIPMFSNPVTVLGKTYDEFKTTDPGMALITGKCRDLGKFKVPRLR